MEVVDPHTHSEHLLDDVTSIACDSKKGKKKCEIYGKGHHDDEGAAYATVDHIQVVGHTKSFVHDNARGDTRIEWEFAPEGTGICREVIDGDDSQIECRNADF